MIHAFDSKSRSFGKFGDRQDLWNESSKTAFDTRAKCLEKQYSKFELNGEKVDGERTLGENLADSEGLRLAFDAFRLYAQRNYDPATQRLPGEMRGFSPDQLFYLSFGNLWCSQIRNYKLSQMLSDGYAPKKFRVNGAISNSLFGEVFKCPSPSPMNPPKEEQCLIW